jgi:hypothetical protein
MKKDLLLRYSAVRLLSCFICLTAAIQTRAQAPAVTIHSDLPAASIIKQIIHGNGLFLANLSTSFYTSTNGVTWKQVPGPTLHGNVNNSPSFAYGAGNFVCVGDSGAVSTSTDGQTWTERSSGTTNYLTDIRFFNGDFYAVGNNATFLHSGNGTHWHPLSTGKGAPADQYKTIDYGNGYFLISAITPESYAVTYRSGPDTLGNWRTDTLPPSVTKEFFVKQYFYRIDAPVQTSTDAVNWTPVPHFPPGNSRNIDGGFYDSAHVYLVSTNFIVGDYGNIYSSADGLNFNSVLNSSLGVFGGLHVGRHDYIFGLGGAERSTDGINYKMLGMNFQSVAFHDSTEVGVGNANQLGLIRRSTDFVTWKDNTPDSTPSLSSVVYDGSRYLAVGPGPYGAFFPPNPGAVYASPHGVNWTKLSSTSPSLLSLTYNAGRYVAVGYDSMAAFGGQHALYFSSDGVNWRAVYSGDSTQQRYFNRVKYLNGHFFAIGQAPNLALKTFLLSSTDGINWTNISPHLPFDINNLDDLIYDGSKYILMGTEDDSDLNPANFFSMSTTNVSNPDSWSNKGTITSPPPGSRLASGNAVQTFAYSHGRYVGGAGDLNQQGNGYLIYSSDAIHWSYLPLGTSSGIIGIDTAGALFRVVGSGNLWLTVTFPTTGTSSSADTLAGLAVSPALSQDPRFRVYPNPAAGSATVVLPETGAAIAVLYNAAGGQVMEKVFNDQTITLPLQGLPAGVYHLTVRQNGKQYTRAILHP